jgi:hypothetical protein
VRVKEGGHRLGEVAQCLLLYRLGTSSQPRMLGSGGGELLALFSETWRALTTRPPMKVLLEGEIPHKSGMGAVSAKDSLLGNRGNQAISRHANTVAIAADILEGVKQRTMAEISALQSR